jgi:predicted outer membrane protein
LALPYTAGTLDIAAAKKTLRRSRNKVIRSFANNMIRDRSKVNNKALALVRKLHVTPQPNPLRHWLRESLPSLDTSGFNGPLPAGS